MDADFARLYADLEDTHWWWLGRREIVESTLKRIDLGEGAEILEMGCASGGNLPMIARFGSVTGCEPDPYLARRAGERGVGEVVQAGIPLGSSLAGRRFDLILALDVLEHIEDDAGALRELRALLDPGGRLVMTVPAYPWLWTVHDERCHHVRRYTAGVVRDRVVECGFERPRVTYFNTVLFPLALAQRLATRLRPSLASADVAVPPARVNRLLHRVFSAERHVVSRLGLPMGLSILVEARVGATADPS